MKTVGIIAEYNPFHLGHKYHIDKVRELYGEDTAIVAVMSGNLTQRGEVAIFDKAERARAAVLCGVNLVLELPFPHSCASAQFFAEGAIAVLDAIGIVDILSFGSECADINKLSLAAEILSNEALINSDAHDTVGYAKRCEDIYISQSGTQDNILTPNNILGIEYIKALKKNNSRITPQTIKRLGDAYSESSVHSRLASAMAIRELIYKNDVSAFDYVPEEAKNTFLEAINKGVAPCLCERLDAAVISFLRLNPPKALDKEIHDAKGGLYNRIQAKSLYANSISSLTESVKTKKYTTARIRRAIWYSYFGVTSSDVKNPPQYTQILAMDDIGAALLKRIKKESNFPVLTKPCTNIGQAPSIVHAKQLSEKADSVLQLTKPVFVRGDAGVIFTPFVKK